MRKGSINATPGWNGLLRRRNERNSVRAYSKRTIISLYYKQHNAVVSAMCTTHARTVGRTSASARCDEQFAAPVRRKGGVVRPILCVKLSRGARTGWDAKLDMRRASAGRETYGKARHGVAWRGVAWRGEGCRRGRGRIRVEENEAQMDAGEGIMRWAGRWRFQYICY